ncbi:MAG TPA: type II toxin-antitoxin system RelE/ParE family toxin [Casimicrobiaceae bacterium]|nr:type II toxin-antitoxin system RelE/ParE family toxin [Casimicrobiaceae bacterium]
MPSIEVRHYLTPEGRDPFAEWVERLRDKRARAAVLLRIGRMERGLFGDARSVGGGVSELRIDVGPGYRVYFGRIGDRIVLLLCGGDKRRQDDDIARAKRYWASYSEGTGTQ